MSETPEFLKAEEVEEKIQSIALKCRMCGEDIQTDADLVSFRIGSSGLCSRCADKLENE
jgi:hypothetical protein